MRKSRESRQFTARVSWTQMSEPDRTSTTPKGGCGSARRGLPEDGYNAGSGGRRHRQDAGVGENDRRHHHAWLHPG